MEENYARLQDRGDHDDPPLPPALLRGTPESILSPDPIAAPELAPGKANEEEIIKEFTELSDQIESQQREDHPEWDWD